MPGSGLLVLKSSSFRSAKPQADGPEHPGLGLGFLVFGLWV